MLVNAPLRNQLNEPTTDGRPDENARSNCAQAAAASLLSGYTGQAIYGDQLKDLAYGEAYTGATDPMHDADVVLADWGAHIVQERPPTANDGAWMVARIGSYLRQHTGVLGAIPSQWGDQTNAYILAHPDAGTHEVAFCDATFNTDGSVATLTAMNPWPAVNNNAFYQTQPAAWWAARLVYNRINPVLPPAGSTPQGSGDYPPMLQITDPAVATFFSLTSAGAWQCRRNSVLVANAVLDYYRTHDGLARFGLPLAGESYPKSGCAVQLFERGAIAWDPKRQLDNPPVPASDQCYAAHVDSGVVLTWLESALQQQLTAQLTQAEADRDAAKSAASAAQAQLAGVQQQLVTAQGQQAQDAAALQTAQDAATQAQQQLAAATAQVSQLQAQLDAASKATQLIADLKALLAA